MGAELLVAASGLPMESSTGEASPTQESPDVLLRAETACLPSAKSDRTRTAGVRPSLSDALWLRSRSREPDLPEKATRWSPMWPKRLCQAI